MEQGGSGANELGLGGIGLPLFEIDMTTLAAIRRGGGSVLAREMVESKSRS
jgi:hypothetical protein